MVKRLRGVRRIRGTCSACNRIFVVRADGNVAYHWNLSKRRPERIGCPGAGHPPNDLAYTPRKKK